LAAHSAHEVIAVSGSNVSLNILQQLPCDYSQLNWYYSKGQKIVELDSGLKKPTYFGSKFKGRVNLDSSSGSLSIFDVKKEDSSIYLLKVLHEAGNEDERDISLQVFDPLPNLVIKIERREENNSCHIKLSCAIEDSSVNYTWFGDSGPFPKELQNSVLEITLTPENYSKYFTCQVRNPVSSRNDTVYFTLPCTLARSSGVSSVATWLVVIMPFVLGLLFT
ncbi:CD48 antigen, partial [Dasypus novemcinctus]|uniref:CD48 antigen n=1 Tax=Dasypus novemcinctus TaxID=9361 RepID=UPI00265EE1AD